jgi:hypothetical protein
LFKSKVEEELLLKYIDKFLGKGGDVSGVVCVFENLSVTKWSQHFEKLRE